MLSSFSQDRGGRRQIEIKDQLRKSHRSEQTIKKEEKGNASSYVATNLKWFLVRGSGRSGYPN